MATAYGYKRARQTDKYETDRKATNLGRFGKPPNKRWTQVVDADRKARKMADKDLENINATVDIPEAAQEGLRALLITVRSKVVSHADRTRAAGKLLEFTMSKPVAKTEIAISQAEAWLNSLKD